MATTRSKPAADVRRRTQIPTDEQGTSLTGWNPGQPDQWLEHVPEMRWPENIHVFARMATDPQCASVLLACLTPLFDAKWALDPAGCDPAVAEFVSKQLTIPLLGQPPVLRAARGAVKWTEHMRTAVWSAAKFGHGVFEQVYQPVMGPNSELLLGLRKLGHRPAATIHEWDHAPDGGLRSVTQHVAERQIGQVVLDINRLVLYSLDRETGDWTGKSLLRNAFKPWFLKDQLLRIAQIGVERGGVGVPVVKYPGTSETDLQKALTIATSVRAGDDAGVALGKDWDLILAGVQGKTIDPLPLINYHDQQIAKSVLAMFLDLGHDSGARSLGDTFTQVFTSVVNSLRAWIEETATEHVVRDLVEINYGPDTPWPLIRAPRIEAEQTVTPSLVGELITAGALTWTPDLEAQLRQMLRLPQADVAELQAAHDRNIAATKPAPPIPGATLSEASGKSLADLAARIESLRAH